MELPGAVRHPPQAYRARRGRPWKEPIEAVIDGGMRLPETLATVGEASGQTLMSRSGQAAHPWFRVTRRPTG